jgi:hypothetical protein
MPGVLEEPANMIGAELRVALDKLQTVGRLRGWGRVASAVLESQVRIAIAEVGLDPTIGYL